MKRLIAIPFYLALGSLAMTFGAILGIVEMFKPVRYLIPILFVGILFTSCDDNPKKMAEDGTQYRVDTIEDCEYLYRGGANQGYMAHKGNCSNPIHKYNK